MSIRVLYQTPRGEVVDIPSSIKSLIADISVLDSRLHVQFNYDQMKYEVWRMCEDGKDRIISSYDPNEFGSNVLIDLKKNDLRHNPSFLSDLEKQNESVEKDNTRKLKEWEEEEVNARLHFIVKKYATGGEDYTATEGRWYMKDQKTKPKVGTGKPKR